MPTIKFYPPSQLPDRNVSNFSFFDSLMKRKLELQQTKQDLWKLRKQENKQIQNEEINKIREMSKKLEVLKEILEQEKQKAEELEKEKTRKINKKERDLELAAEKAKKWAMIRWVNDYIEENQEKWDNDDLIRTLDKYEQEKRQE